MSNWQTWLVAFILLLCAVRIIQSIYAFFRRAKEKSNPCDTCISGCELKDLLDKKRTECASVQKDAKKKCCK